MITLTKLNGEEFILNCDLIETVLGNPDTVIALTNGRKMIVRETPGEVADKVLEYRRKIFTGLFSMKE